MIKKGDKIMTPLGESQVAYVGDDGSVVTTMGTVGSVDISQLASPVKNYVKEYKGHKVPDGATHYGAKNNVYVDCFYKKGFNRRPSQDLWSPGDQPIPYHAIELPLAKEEFEPAVGDWFRTSGNKELFYVGINDIGQYVCSTRYNQLLALQSFNWCKPLKSDRDIAIEKAVEVWKKEGQPESSSRDWPNADILGALYDAGLLK